MSDASLSTGYYSIIVGGQTFKLSTTALYSDSPNYFTEIFSSPLEESRTKTMIIDRDPAIFADIVSGKSIKVIVAIIFFQIAKNSKLRYKFKLIT